MGKDSFGGSGFSICETQGVTVKRTNEQKTNQLLRYFCDDTIAGAIAEKLPADLVQALCDQLAHEGKRAEYFLAKRISEARTLRDGMNIANTIAGNGEPPEPEFIRSRSQSK